MKRKFLALLCIAAMLVLVFASCGNSNKNPDDQPDVCEHTYSDKWSTSSTEHWHAATCEHAELKADVASHTDADQDGKCDVCDFEIGHEHTFETKWTTNETHHWHVATCSHTDEKGELAAHVDADSDGACDVCSVHVHVLNLHGNCTVCGKHVVDVDVTDINVVLPIVLSNSGKVVGGNIAYENIITDLDLVYNEKTGEYDVVPYYITATKDVVFLLGKGAAFYQVVSSSDYGYGVYTDTQEKWYELLADGTAFGVYQDSYDGFVGDFEVDGAASENDLVGYYFSVSTLTDAYGAENLLSALFTLSQSASASNYTYLYDEETAVYSFSFGYLAVNSDTGEGEGDHADYYELEVSFTVSESGMLTSLDVACDCYTNSLEDDIDNDYIYDQNSGTIIMKDTAAADTYTFKITQSEGARTYVTEHPKSDFFPESFDAFVDAELTEKLGDTVTVTEGNTLVLYFGNFLPEGTGAKYLMDTFTTKLDEMSPIFAWAYDGTASFYCGTAGTYPVEFTLGDETFAFTLVVEAYVPDVIEYPENSVPFVVTGDDTYAWTALVTFVAPADGDYTFYVPAGIGAWDKASCDSFSGAPYVDFYSEYGGTFTVSVKAGETYEFYVSATEKCSSYLTYTVDEYTGSGDIGGGDVTTSDNLVVGSNTVSFTAEEIDLGAGSKTFVVTTTANYTFRCDIFVSSVVDSNGNAVTAVNYEYPLVAGETYTVTFGMFFIANITAGTPVNITVTASEISGGDTDGDELTVTEGTYVGSDMFGNSPLTVVVEGNTVTITFNHPLMGLSTLVATYEIVDGAVVLYNEDGTTVHPLAGSLTIDEDGTPVSASYNGNDYTLAAGSTGDGSDDDDNETIEPDGYVYPDMDNTVTVTEAQYESAEKIYLSFSVWESGEYTFYSNDLYVSALIAEDGTVITRNDNWAFELEAWCTYLVEVSTMYVPSAGEYTLTVEYIYPAGHQNNPYWYEMGTETTATYLGNNSIVWYQFYAGATGTLTVSTAFEGATIFLTAHIGDNVEGVGTASLCVVQDAKYYIGIAAFEETSAVDIVFNASIVEGDITTDGTINVPHFVTMGENVGNVPSWSYVYFMYKAEANGILTLTTANANSAWYVTTDLSGVNYTQSGDLSIQLYVGDIAYICIETLNGAAEAVTFNASFAADPTEIWYEDTILTDGTPNTLVMEDNSYVGLVLYANGEYTVSWDVAGAIVTIGGVAIENGAVITCNSWWSTWITVYLDGYAAGSVNLTIAPYVDTNVAGLELGDNSVAVVDNSMGDTYALPVNETETVTYVLTVGANGVLIVNGSDIYFEGQTVEITVVAGEIVTIAIGAYSYENNVANINVAVKSNDNENEGGAGDGNEGNDGTATLGSATIAAPGNFKFTAWETLYTAETTGTFVITAEGYDSIQNTYIQIKINGGDTILVAKGATNENGMPYSITLNAGDVLEVRLYGWNDADKGIEVTVIIAPVA